MPEGTLVFVRPGGDPVGVAALGRMDPGWRTGLLGQQKGKAGSYVGRKRSARRSRAGI